MVKNKLVHRDLKLENILIKYKNAEKTKYEVKLTDYGISRQLLSLTKKLTTKIGTNVFMAPEVEHGEKYNQECDLWSIGIIIYILFFKEYPEIKDNNDQIKSTGNLDLDDLIRKLLVVNPENRLSWNNYFDHSFFKNNIFEQNQIIIEIEVRNQDKINNEFKDMYFLECNYYYESDKQKPFSEENEEIKNLDQTNTNIYINDAPVNFCKFFKPSGAGIYKIKIVFKKKMENCKFMFRNCTNIISIDLSAFDSSNVNNMNYMFGRCFELKNINLTNLDTRKVTDMGYMFNKCKKLEKINLPSSFNTENVKNMEFMFHHCEKLEEITFPTSFKTDNVIKMKAMFGKCSKLKKLDLRNFNTKNVNNMSYMFDNCYDIEEILIDPKIYQTNQVTDMGQMFKKCYNLRNIDLSFLDIEKVKYLCFMFSECLKLINIDLSKLNFKDGNEIDMTYMFNNCCNLQKIDLSSFKIPNDEKIINMFNGLKNIEKIKVNNDCILKLKELFKDVESKFVVN